MVSDKTQIHLSLIGLAVALLTSITTVTIKVIDVMAEEPDAVAMTTNAAGTNSAGTNAAADPKHAVVGNTGHIEKYNEPDKAPSNTIPFPKWAVVLILCGLVAVACMLINTKVSRRMRDQQVA